jgi:hypothetical protein
MAVFPTLIPAVFTVPVAGRGWKMLERSGYGRRCLGYLYTFREIEIDYTGLVVDFGHFWACSAACQEALRPDFPSGAGDHPLAGSGLCAVRARHSVGLR